MIALCTLLRELHWLPVRYRVLYKIAELTFKPLHVDMSPAYLQQCVQVYTLYTSQVSLFREQLHACAEQIPLVSWRLHFRARSCHSLEFVACFRHIQRLTAIIQSSLEDSYLCIGIHVTKPCLHILNNVILIMLS